MFSKRHLKRTFSLILPAGNAVFEDPMVGPNLSPFINRDKINSFCSDFNKSSLIYKEQLDLYVTFFLYSDSRFFYKIRGPKLFHLLNLVVNEDSLLSTTSYKNVSIFDFYDIIYFKWLFYIKTPKFNDIFLKKQIFINICSVKNLILYNDYMYWIDNGHE